MRFFTMISAFICVLCNVSGQESTPTPSLLAAEGTIETALKSEPTGKSLTGLLAIFIGKRDLMAEIAKIDTETLHHVALAGGLPGVVMLAMAKGKKEKSLSPEDVIALSLEVFRNISDTDMGLGVAGPIFDFWQNFDGWPLFIKDIPQLHKLFDRLIVYATVFVAIPPDALLSLVKSPNLSFLNTVQQADLLEKAHNQKLIDLSSPQWTGSLQKYYLEGSAAGQLLFLSYTPDRTPEFREKIRAFIVKFQDDTDVMILLNQHLKSEVEQLNVADLPIKDSLKKILVK